MTLQNSLNLALTSIRSQLSSDNPLSELAWKAFMERGLPQVKDEAFQYLKLAQLMKLSPSYPALTYPNEGLLEKALSPYEGKNVLVFYQGRFLPRYSSYEDLEDELVILPFSQASQTYGSFFNHYFEHWIKKETDSFALLALALHFEEGLFVYVPKNTEVEHEVFLLELSDLSGPSWTAPLSLFSVGANSSLTLTTEVYGEDNPEHLVCAYTGFQLEEGAKLTHSHGARQSKGIRFEAARATLKRNSTYQQTQVTLNPHKNRVSFQAELSGEGAFAQIQALAALKEKQEAHMHILIEHQAPHCQSSQLVKNLLDGESVSSFEGKIYVHSVAQKTDAYQLNANCILSDDAKAYSKPNLEIFADDVKASHGSTTGQVNLEEQFYLQSRGLSKAAARKMLLKGFCDEVLISMSSKQLKKQLLQQLHHYFAV